MGSSEPTVTISKKIQTTKAYGTTYTLTVTVRESSEISPAIFLFEYMPRTPYSVGQVYTFSNVCYLDELYNVPDELTEPDKAQLIRRTTLTKSFSSRESLDTFYEEILSDIRRLLKAFRELAEGNEDGEDYFFTVSEDSVLPTDPVATNYSYRADSPSPADDQSPSDGVIELDASGDLK